MDKVQFDELYHNLRRLCVTEDMHQKEAVAGIVSHLTRPQGDYTGLLRFLSYYGETFLLPSIVEQLRSASKVLRFSRIVDLGAGFGWLGRGISNAFNLMPAVFVDKRQWVLIDIVADIESKNGVKRVLDVLRDGDLIVMSELLHCLNDPEETLRPFTKWPILAVEYWPLDALLRASYNDQIKKFSCKPIGNIRDVFPSSKIHTHVMDPYTMWLVRPV